MATNNFKPFANGNSANVTSQSDYEALPALSSGFTAGKASSAQVNKALRQGSVMSSVLAQFIANASGNDVLDNGNVTTILTNLLLALKSNGAGSFLQISNNLNEISSAGATAIAAALANLGLSDALHRGDAKILTGTRVSTAESARAIGERAIGGCQFMQAYKAPDAPNQTDYWQVIVMPDTSDVGGAPLAVIAISLGGGNVAIGNGTTSGLAWTTLSKDSQVVKSMRFGAVEQGNVFQNPGFADSLGYVITGVQNADSNDTPDKLQRRTIQMNINNQWLTLGA